MGAYIVLTKIYGGVGGGVFAQLRHVCIYTGDSILLNSSWIKNI